MCSICFAGFQCRAKTGASPFSSLFFFLSCTPPMSFPCRQSLHTPPPYTHTPHPPSQFHCNKNLHFHEQFPCLVCVCVCERERERERACVCLHTYVVTDMIMTISSMNIKLQKMSHVMYYKTNGTWKQWTLFSLYIDVCNHFSLFISNCLHEVHNKKEI